MLSLRTLSLAGACILSTTAPLLAADFDMTVAVRVNRGLRGPRGMPGDLILLQDGSLLMSYTPNARS